MAPTNWRARSIPAAAAGEWFASDDWSRLRVGLSRRFGFSGGVARLAALDLVVFSSDHAKLALRESCRGADRIFHFGDRAAVAGGGADCVELVPDFQQCELVARERGDRIRSMVRAAARQPLLRHGAALAEKIVRENHGAGCRRWRCRPSSRPRCKLAFR